MGSSAGRRSAHYVRTRELFKLGATCWMCGKYGPMTPDHQPPLSTAPTPDQWKGQLLPACADCQSRQGARIRNDRRWTW